LLESSIGVRPSACPQVAGEGILGPYGRHSVA